MSEFHVEVSEVKNVQKHPNADTLSIAEVNGYPVIFRTGEYAEGQLAVYVPIDSIVPDKPEWSFLDGHRRIKAKRLRGIFSMGMLSKALPKWTLGQDVQAELEIEKWEPTMPATMGGDDAPDAGILPIYTDIEGYRRHKNVLIEGEEVVITEKIHGANARFCFHDGQLIVGSHKRIKKVFDTEFPSMWARVAIALGLDKKLSEMPDIAIYGEVYGQVQDLKYGKTDTDLVLFDAMDLRTRAYLDHDAFLAVTEKLEIPTVPQLYRGPWSAALLALSEGPSAVPGANNIREGFVVKPARERYEHMGRVILKMVGEAYLLRKAA